MISEKPQSSLWSQKVEKGGQTCEFCQISFFKLNLHHNEPFVVARHSPLQSILVYLRMEPSSKAT